MPRCATPRAARRLGLLGGLLWFVLACSGGIPELGGGDDELVAEATRLRDAHQLPEALAEYERLSAENPESVTVAIGLAYMQVLAGDLGSADATLEAIQTQAGDQVGEILLRRALVALRGRDLDNVLAHGEASGLPEGKLLAAEVLLVELSSDRAIELLRGIQSTPGVVGQTATTYLSMLESNDVNLAGLADSTALWALGDRRGACESAEDLVKALSPDHGDKDTLLLLWAGRSVTSGLPAVARSLLDEIAFPPEGQEWRWQATQAMVMIAEGKVDRGMAKFDALKGGVESGDVPPEGLDDALATACSLTEDVELAKKLVEGVESAAAARCLMEVGASADAGALAPQGALRQFLEKQ